jgi:hypothetical protein
MCWHGGRLTAPGRLTSPTLCAESTIRAAAVAIGSSGGGGRPYTIALAAWLSYVMKAPQFFKAQLLGNALGVPVSRDNHHKRYPPSAEWRNQHSAANDLVMGSADLAFCVGFDRNLLDDIMLGTTTEKVYEHEI